MASSTQNKIDYGNSPVQGQVSLLLALGQSRGYLFGLVLRIDGKKDPPNATKADTLQAQGTLNSFPVAYAQMALLAAGDYLLTDIM